MLKKKESKTKKSIDFTNESINLLEEYKTVYGMASYNEIINRLIETFIGLSPKIKKELAITCSSELRELDQSTMNELPYERLENQKIESQYNKLLYFFNEGQHITVQDAMQRIEIKDGYVICPNEWIVVCPQNAKSSRYVGVVEVKNGQDYGAPHFIFFSEKPINQMTDIDTNIIDEECCLKFPNYRKILKDNIPLKFDVNRKPINIKEHLSSPIPGYFTIPDYERNSYSSYPFGAMVFRY